MVKSREDVVTQFNEHVNMNVEELQQWLDDPKSTKAGTGVGLESGHKIIEILKKNPEKDPEKYDEEDIEHMRKVVSYNARHLAQEDRLKDTKTKEELENAKSTISLKNWGHDPIKTLDEDENAADEKSSILVTEPGEQEKANGTAGDGETHEASANGGNKEESNDTESTQGEKGGSKRKLGDGGEADDVAKEAAKEEGGYEDEDPSDAVADQEGRARKRTKTADDADAEVDRAKVEDA